MAEVLISGPEGRIEARYKHSAEKNPRIALILHPDPTRGGTMNTKVVYNLYNTFVNNDFSTLRFNFRGVGKSDGKFDGGEGELSDAAVILDWLQNNNPNTKQDLLALHQEIKTDLTDLKEWLSGTQTLITHIFSNIPLSLLTDMILNENDSIIIEYMSKLNPKKTETYILNKPK